MAGLGNVVLSFGVREFGIQTSFRGLGAPTEKKKTTEAEIPKQSGFGHLQELGMHQAMERKIQMQKFRNFFFQILDNSN